MPSGKIRWSNSLFATLSKEGGFAYGLYENGTLHPVSYNGEGSYRRISVIDGVGFHYTGDSFTLDGTGGGIQLFPSEYGASIMNLPFGGFITLGVLIAVMQYALKKAEKKKAAAEKAEADEEKKEVA